MSKINVLHSTVYNRIAAGEVVERPFSVVKELVENSIDAGADDIVIDITGNGIECIKITDNGSGILKEDLINAYMPHATSKVLTVNDLENIMTLGFRGEALASIASVSKMNINSKPSLQEIAYSLSCDGGKLGEITPSSLDNGTIITVRNLFYNTPARAKFLKSGKSESQDIINIVSRIALGNPNKKFTLTGDGKTLLKTFGEGLESSVISIYGAEAVNNSFYIDTIKSGIKIFGYIGKHNYTKPNRTYQNLFINGRYVLDNTVGAAISNCYSPYLMKRQYAFYVLNLSVPYDAIDVNVHPNKTEVRFENNQVIYSAVYSVISSVLDGTLKAIDIVKSDNLNTSKDEPTIEKQLCSSFESETPTNNDVFYSNIETKTQNNQSHYNLLTKQASENQKYEGELIKLPKVQVCDHTYVDEAEKVFNENKRFLNKPQNEQSIYNKFNAKKEETVNAIEQQKISYLQPVYVGQLFSTYLIYQISDEVYFIDQHAAHEKIIFDKYISEIQDGVPYRQPLLIPYILSLNSLEYNYIQTKLQFLKDAGFDIDEFGDTTYKINEVPMIFKDLDCKKFFDDILSDLNNPEKNYSEYVRDRIAVSACKAAVKGGDNLTKSEIDELVNNLNGDFNLKCPHGRPIAIRITRTELEKWFKRIV